MICSKEAFCWGTRLHTPAFGYLKKQWFKRYLHYLKGNPFTNTRGSAKWAGTWWNYLCLLALVSAILRPLRVSLSRTYSSSIHTLGGYAVLGLPTALAHFSPHQPANSASGAVCPVNWACPLPLQLHLPQPAPTPAPANLKKPPGDSSWHRMISHKTRKSSCFA